MLSLKTAFLKFQNRHLYSEFEHATKNPEQEQLSLLKRIIANNENTVFGKEHRFTEIQSVKDFRLRVPIRDYLGLQPFIVRATHGEKNILTRENPFSFQVTSGTTSEPKYIPLTSWGERNLREGLMLRMLLTLKDHPTAYDHGQVLMASAAVEGKTPGGIPFGSSTGLVRNRLPFYFKSKFLVPPEAARIEDYDIRYFVALRFAIEKQISGMFSPNPSTFVRLAEVGVQNANALIKAVSDGTLGVQSNSPLLKDLEARLSPNKQRARELETILNKFGKFTPEYYWPKLEMMWVWTGGSVGVQLSKLPSYYGPHVCFRDVGFSSSEGRVTIPTKDYSRGSKTAGALAVRHIFLEFIPEAEIESQNPNCLLAHELEIGKRYSVILTTVNGLYRYDINDIIEVTGFYNNTPEIAFVRKGRDMTNITGEKMHVNHCIQAIEQVARSSNIGIKQMRVAANVIASQYEIYLELDQSCETSFALELIYQLDAALMKSNVEYEAKRKSRRLLCPQLHIMRPGWGEEMRKLWTRQGGRDIQFKWKVLTAEPQESDQPYIQKTYSLNR